MISASGSTNIGGSGNRENQDAFFVGEHMFGVFDGHGRAGRSVAMTVCTVFAEASLDDLFPKMFADAEEATHNVIGSYAPAGAGGTTASVLYVDPVEGFCQVGHVGDSEVRYFDEEGDGVSLTEDHSATSLYEFHRVRATSAPADYEFPARPGQWNTRPVFLQDEDGNWAMDPRGGNYHCNVRKDWAAYLMSPCGEDRLAVTRALGDFNMKFHGVSAEPTVTTVDPPAEDVIRAIVLASDGLWDAMQYAEVGAVVRDPAVLGNAEAATAALMAAALAANDKHFGDNADNITAVVVYMSAPPAAEEVDDEPCISGEGRCPCCGEITMYRE